REAGEVQAYTPDEMRAFLLHAQNSSGRVLVTVSGISGSGKSTFARQLAADLDAPIVETDNLHIGAAKLLEQYSEVNHDLPHAYDYAYAGHAALRLALGNAVDVPLYDYESAEPTGKTMRIDPTGSG